MLLFRHALHHADANSEFDRKVAIVHIDHAIDLILKEKLERLNLPIYGNNGRARFMRDMIEELIQSGVPVPEQQAILDLHALRNDLQHVGTRFLDENTRQFHMRSGDVFLRRFLPTELQYFI